MEIQNLPFFEAIDPNVINGIKKVSSTVTFENGRQIFSKGDPADYLYILEQGTVELVLKEQEHKTLVLSDPGEVFGWSSIVEKGVYTSTVICKSDTIVQRIARPDIESIFNRHPKAALKFYQRLGTVFSRRLSKAVE